MENKKKKKKKEEHKKYELEPTPPVAAEGYDKTPHFKENTYFYQPYNCGYQFSSEATDEENDILFGLDTAANFVTGRRAGRISFSLTSTLAQVGLEVLLLYSSDFVPQMKKMLPPTSNLFYTRVFLGYPKVLRGIIHPKSQESHVQCAKRRITSFHASSSEQVTVFFLDIDPNDPKISKVYKCTSFNNGSGLLSPGKTSSSRM